MNDEEAALVIAYAESVVVGGVAYAGAETKSGRIVCVLTEEELPGSELDMNLITTDRAVAFAWLTDRCLADRLREALADHDDAEEAASITGDLTRALRTADAVIDLARELMAPALLVEGE